MGQRKTPHNQKDCKGQTERLDKVFLKIPTLSSTSPTEAALR